MDQETGEDKPAGNVKLAQTKPRRAHSVKAGDKENHQHQQADGNHDVVLHRAFPLHRVATPTGFEPVAPRLGIWCSILLSYGIAWVTFFHVFAHAKRVKRKP
jgi:hypothetical protein